MEFYAVEENKNKLVFQLKGESHTFCNLLRDELQQLKEVTLATYKIDHPLVGVPTFVLETKGASPREALKEALAVIKKKAKEFQKEISSL